jgi:hypothetical protein
VGRKATSMPWSFFIEARKVFHQSTVLMFAMYGEMTTRPSARR